MRKDNITLVFDMDGTIADLYGVNNWLADLRAEKTTPYEKARAIYGTALNDLLVELKKAGIKVAVTTWTAKGGSKEYNKAVARVKKEWLIKNDFPFDEFHAVKYGTTKANCTRKNKGIQILIDDNEKIRKGWNLGATIDANKDIIEILQTI